MYIASLKTTSQASAVNRANLRVCRKCRPGALTASSPERRDHAWAGMESTISGRHGEMRPGAFPQTRQVAPTLERADDAAMPAPLHWSPTLPAKRDILAGPDPAAGMIERIDSWAESANASGNRAEGTAAGRASLRVFTLEPVVSGGILPCRDRHHHRFAPAAPHAPLR